MNDLVTINRSTQDVFDFVANHANDKLWKPFVTVSRQITTGTIGVGTQFEVGMMVLKHSFTSNVEIVEYEPYRWYVYKSNAQPFPFVAQLSFESITSGTAISGHVEFQVHGLWKGFAPIIQTFFKSQEKPTFTKLKTVLEIRM